MQGQLDAPTAGEPSKTPGNGAAQTAPGDESLPTSGSPTSPDLLQERFRAGYGKGAERGRKEGQQAILQELGFGSLDEARSHLQRATEDDGSQQAQFKDAMAQVGKLDRANKELQKQLDGLSKRADQARVDKLRAAALGAGVGPGRQLDAFVALHGESVVISDDMGLEVVKRINGTVVPTGQAVDDWLADVLADARFLLKPDSQRGAGSKAEPLRAQQTGPDLALFGVPAKKRQQER
jgi:hypothetical protein